MFSGPRESEGEEGEDSRQGRGGGSSAASGFRPDGGGRSGAARRGTRAGGRGGGQSGPGEVEDLMAYLRELERAEDFEEVNFMELLRQGHFVTTLTESEVTSLLAGFEEQDPEDMDRGELEQIFQALVFVLLCSVFTKLMCEHHDDHDHEHEHGDDHASADEGTAQAEPTT